MQRERPATKASLPALFQAALVCPQRAPTKGVRRQQKGKGTKPKECAEKEKKEEKRRTGGPRESFSAENCALQVFERCFRPPQRAPTKGVRRQAERAGRDRASALKSAASRCSGVVGVAASHPACEREGGLNPRPVHAHVRLRLGQSADPCSSFLWVCCASCQGRLFPPRPGAERHCRILYRR